MSLQTPSGIGRLASEQSLQHPSQLHDPLPISMRVFTQQPSSPSGHTQELSPTLGDGSSSPDSSRSFRNTRWRMEEGGEGAPEQLPVPIQLSCPTLRKGVSWQAPTPIQLSLATVTFLADWQAKSPKQLPSPIEQPSMEPHVCSPPLQEPPSSIVQSFVYEQTCVPIQLLSLTIKFIQSLHASDPIQLCSLI